MSGVGTACAGSGNALQFSAYPHFEYPQLKHVAHPSMTIMAVVLHLWQRVAPGEGGGGVGRIRGGSGGHRG